MRLIRLALPVVVTLAAAGSAAAQAPSHPAGHGTGHDAGHAPAQPAAWTGDLPAHFEGVALSEAQKARIATLQHQYHARMAAIRDSAKAAGAAVDAPAVKAQVQQVMAEEHAAFRALLDDAGRARFDANMARMHAGEHGAAATGAAHGSGHGTAQGAGQGAGHGAGHGTPPAGGTPGGRPPRR
jgi:hypothetical protein